MTSPATLWSEELIHVETFRASSAQKGLWLAQKMTPELPNHALALWEVDAHLDATALSAAFRRVVSEAEVLRVTFHDQDGDLRLRRREVGDWQPFVLDVSDAPDPPQAARDALAQILGEPFDLERDLLLRLGLVRLGVARTLVAIAYHHLVSDGYGAGLLARRVAEVYTQVARGEPVPPLPHPWDLTSFAERAGEYADSPEFAEDSQFWREHLAQAPAPARLPNIRLGKNSQDRWTRPLGEADRWCGLTSAIGVVSRTVTVPRAEAATWQDTAKTLGVWLSSLITAATAVYLRHRCERPDFLLSMAVANRAAAAAETPGLAVNLVPVRMRVPLGTDFAELAEAVVDETYDFFGHTGLHYSDIQRSSGTALSGRSAFGVAVNVVEFAELLYFGGRAARHIGASNGTFDELSITVYTDGHPDSELFLRLDAPAGLYSAAELGFTACELRDCVRALVAGDPYRPIGALEVPVSLPDRPPGLYVLGPGLSPVPVGVTADVYAAGPPGEPPQSPTQVAQQVVPCPFGAPGGVMHRTGERARWSELGHLEPVGRSDTVFFADGVRVEAGPVEAAIDAHPAVNRSAAAVWPDESGQPRLVAYLVPAADDSPPSEEVRRFVAGRLPEFMLPSTFVWLEWMPLTGQGRVDTARLPRPEFTAAAHRGPRNPTEKILTTLFAEVLERDRVGIDDDFFDLGGNSLRAIRLTGLIRTELGLEVSIRRLFAARTVLGLSDAVHELARSDRPTLSKRTKDGEML